MSPNKLLATCLAVAWCPAAPALGAQEPVHVSGEPTCAECVIALDTVLTLGGISGPGLHVIIDGAHVAVDRLGRILVANRREAEISVFAPDGRFLQTLGGRGQGPGEFRLPISRVGVGTRYLHVFEFHGGRTLFDWNLEFVATHRMPGYVWDAVVTEADQAIFAGDLPTSASAGLGFHVLDPSGEVASFGGDVAARSGVWDNLKYVTGNHREVWVLPHVSNRLVRWELGATPTVARVFDRVVEPFERDNPPGFSLPRSFNSGLMLNEDGLWVAWVAPDPEWTDRRVAPGGDRPDVPPSREYDGWLDLVDPSTGLTIARHQSDKTSDGFAKGRGYLILYEETEGGVPYIHLAEPRLVGGPSER